MNDVTDPYAQPNAADRTARRRGSARRAGGGRLP
jgi:hypothetical protein